MTDAFGIGPRADVNRARAAQAEGVQVRGRFRVAYIKESIRREGGGTYGGFWAVGWLADPLPDSDLRPVRHVASVRPPAPGGSGFSVRVADGDRVVEGHASLQAAVDFAMALPIVFDKP